MYFQAAGTRCALDLRDIAHISQERIEQILDLHGCLAMEIDLADLARSLINVAVYRRGVSLSLAPHTVDCSSFTKWLYAERGVRLPRRAVQQLACGMEVGRERMETGDLVFSTGRWNDVASHAPDGVGHVGIAIGPDRVAHASFESGGVTECSLESYLVGREYRGTRRVLPPSPVLTFSTPSSLDVESSEDLIWIIRRELQK